MPLCFPAEYPYNTRMASELQSSRPPKKRITLLIVKQMVTLTTSGFGVVAALAWNSAIQEAVNSYIKPYFSAASGLISLVIYAVLVTVLAVFVTYQLGSLVEKLEKQ